MMRSSIALLILLAATGAAVAGDNNQAYLIQLSPLGTIEGNTLSIDQEDASDSLVRGVNHNLIGWVPSIALHLLTGTDPLLATQRGEGNDASLTLTGEGGELQLLQSNPKSALWEPGQAGGHNTAELAADGNALGGVMQVGELNRAELSLSPGSRGLIGQWGTELSATLEVASGGSGAILQRGTGSSAELNVQSNNSVTYVQVGDGLNTVDASVYSTIPGNILITQIAF